MSTPPLVRAALATLAFASSAVAAPVAQIVPYSGFLDRDGVPVDGEVALRFRLFTDAAALAPPEDPCDGSGVASCVFSEVHPRVAAHAGAFVVRLGRPVGEGAVARDIAPLLRTNTQHFIEVAVGDAAGRWVVLGRQMLNPVPQALFTVQEEIAVRHLQAEVADVGTLTATGSGRAVVGGPAPAVTAGGARPQRLLIGDDGLQAAVGGAAGTLTLNPSSGDVVVGGLGAGEATRLRVTNELTFGAANERPFRGISVTSFATNSEFDEVGDVNMVAANGRSVCFLTLVAVRQPAFYNPQDATCTAAPVNGTWVLSARGRADRATYCAASCVTW